MTLWAEIEHATFTPLVLSATGGMAQQGYYVLQEACILLGNQMESVLQLNNVLATLLTYFLPTSVSDLVHKGTVPAPDSPFGLGHI